MSQQKAKSLGLQFTYAHMGLFDFAVHFVTGEYGAAIKYVAWLCEDEEIKDIDAESNGGYVARGKCFHRDGYVPVVWLPKVPTEPREYATLAHECAHAVFILLDWASVPVEIQNDEIFCHALGHLVNEYLNKNKPEKKIKKKRVDPVPEK